MYDLYDYSQMIAFPERVAKFTQAIAASRPEGAVVCDLGTGFGYFAIVAAKLGARRVYAIEPNDAIGLGPALAADNGVADRIEFIQGLSTAVELPEKVDILVSDLRASMPYHGAHLRAIADARKRFLAPGGRQIPGRDTLRCTVATHPGIHMQSIEPWKGAVPVEIALGRLSDELAGRSCRGNFRPEHVLPELQTLRLLDYHQIEMEDLKVTHSWQVRQEAKGYGFCLFFDSELAPGVAFSGAPGQSKLPYGHFYLPWRQPLHLRPEQWITLELSAVFRNDDYDWTWSVEVADDDRQEVSFDRRKQPVEEGAETCPK